MGLEYNQVQGIQQGMTWDTGTIIGSRRGALFLSVNFIFVVWYFASAGLQFIYGQWVSKTQTNETLLYTLGV